VDQRVGGGVSSFCKASSAHTNHYADGPNGLGRGMKLDALRSWVDNYCSQHPGDLLVLAAEALFIELILSEPKQTDGAR